MKKTTVASKNDNLLPNPDELRLLTSKSKSTTSSKMVEAVQEAKDLILKDCVKKMTEASSMSRERVYLYIWQYAASNDQNVFKGFRLLDLLLKGDDEHKEGLLMRELRSYFNPEQKKNGYYVGFKKFQKKNESDPSTYGIFVSWYVPKEKGKDADKNTE
jgi:hypothetical protein